MKRIIDGRRYDTSTATLIASYHAPYDMGDFHWYEEALYRTRAGAWFVAGEGHAASKYAEHFGQNDRGPGEGLEPLAEADARRWLEEHEETEALERHFGGSIVDA